MWKLVSGIALIILLDVAFIWMMALEPDAPEIARVIEPAALPVIHDEQPAEPLAVDDSTEPLENDVASVRGPRALRDARRQSSRRASVPATGSQAISAVAPENLFQDRVIWIGRTEVPVKIEREPVAIRAEASTSREVQAEVVEAVEPPTARKRSFQSKAFGVIKKPYDLIKAFADKLN